jgi:ligand-binding sensor domain-containing protein
MRSCLFFAVIINILACNNLPAQSLRETEFTLYTRVEGLSNNFITGIAQDSIGYLWVATNRGLNRFDGRFFTNFYAGSSDLPLPDNMIKQIRMQGQELIGTTIVGAFVYNTNSRKGIQLTIPTDSLIFFLTNDMAGIIRDSRGNYVLSTKTGLYVLDSQSNLLKRYDNFKPSEAYKKEFFFGDELSALGNGLILQDNTIYFSAYDPAKNRIDTFYSNQHAEFRNAISDHNGNSRTTFPGQKNQMFIINDENNSLDIFDFADRQVYSLLLPFDISTEFADGSSRLIILNDSLLAITCKGSGFYLFDYYSKSHKLSLHGGKYFDGRHCTAVLLDREKRFWVGTSNGLYKQNLTNPFYHAHDLADQLPDLRNCEIRAILNRGNDLYVGFRNKGGLIVLNTRNYKVEFRFDFKKLGTNYNSVNHIFPYSADTLWIGTSAGILWFDTRNGHFGPLIFTGELSWMNGINPLCFVEDLQKNIWISLARFNTVVRFNRNTRTFTDFSDYKNPLLNIAYCFSMVLDKQGNIWFAGNGISHWNIVKQKMDTITYYSNAFKVLKSYIFILDLDKNNDLWFYSFNNGIIQYKCAENKTYLRKGESNYWDGNIIMASPVIKDHIWMGMDNGISVFDIHDYSSQQFTYADGLPSMPITSIRKGSWYDSAQNIFYFGSGHQLISFKPDLSFSTPSAPDLFIEEIKTPMDIFRGNSGNLTLPYSNNSVQIDFNAVNFRSPEDNRFAYRVNPSADTSWRILNWQHIVNFSNLSPGKYRIQLKLFSANNRWPEQIKQLTITVESPFWKSAWFIGILILTGIAITLFIYRYRIGQIREKMHLNQLMAEYEMKALHAQMNPHFIFNALNSIKEMILYQDTKNASLYLSRFAQLIRLNLEYSMKTFITLRQNIEYLERYLEMEQLRFADFSFHFTIRGKLNVDEIRIAPMMLQPLVENSIWHGLLPSDRDKRLGILFYLDENKLVCEIEDNGIGIQKSMHLKNGLQVIHESVGIENIRKRIVTLNEKYHIQCTLSIVDKKDIHGSDPTGTLAKLVIPQFEDGLFKHS